MSVYFPDSRCYRRRRAKPTNCSDVAEESFSQPMHRYLTANIQQRFVAKFRASNSGISIRHHGRNLTQDGDTGDPVLQADDD